MKPALLLVTVCVLSASAQTNRTAVSNAPSTNAQAATNQAVSDALRVEEIRSACIQQRRMICGKILKVLPDGLVVDSGYSSLTRVPPNGSWLLPGAVVATRDVNVIESEQPDAICIGVVFLSDLPKAQRAKPKPFDYVKIEGFPTGQYTYTSVGDVRRTVRKFACRLPNAVQWKLDQEQIGSTKHQPPSSREAPSTKN